MSGEVFNSWRVRRARFIFNCVLKYNFMKNCARTSGALYVMRIKMVAVVHHELDFSFCGCEVISITY